MTTTSKDLGAYVVSGDARLIDAAEVIVKNHSRTAVVVADGRVIGVISEGDILRALLRGMDVHAGIAGVMRPDFRYLVSCSLNEAFEVFRDAGVNLLPVVDDDLKLVDVITLHWLLQQPGLWKGQ